MCYTLLIITAQMMIPALSGALVWDEPLSALKILGALLMFVSVALSIEYKAEKKATLRWFLFCVAALLCSGSVGVMQKVLGYSGYSQEQNRLFGWWPWRSPPCSPWAASFTAAMARERSPR